MQRRHSILKTRIFVLCGKRCALSTFERLPVQFHASKAPSQLSFLKVFTFNKSTSRVQKKELPGAEQTSRVGRVWKDLPRTHVYKPKQNATAQNSSHNIPHAIPEQQLCKRMLNYASCLKAYYYFIFCLRRIYLYAKHWGFFGHYFWFLFRILGQVSQSPSGVRNSCTPAAAATVRVATFSARKVACLWKVLLSAPPFSK